MQCAKKKKDARQYVYLDRPPVITSTTERLVTESHSKLQSVKTGPFRVIKVAPTTVKNDKDGVGNMVSVKGATVAQRRKR